MTDVRALLSDFNQANPLYANATVTILTVDPATHLVTATLAVVYDAIVGVGTLGNPLTLDGEGKWLVPPYVAVPVILQVTGASVADHSTGITGPPSAIDGDVNFATVPTSDYGLTAFSPTCYFVTGAGFDGVAAISAEYYKIGRMVIWTASIKISDSGTKTGEFRINMNDAPTPDFPATPSGGAAPSWGVNVQYMANMGAFTDNTAGALASFFADLHALHVATHQIRFRYASADETAHFLTDQNVLDGTYLVLSGQYVATA